MTKPPAQKNWWHGSHFMNKIQFVSCNFYSKIVNQHTFSWRPRRSMQIILFCRIQGILQKRPFANLVWSSSHLKATKISHKSQSVGYWITMSAKIELLFCCNYISNRTTCFESRLRFSKQVWTHCSFLIRRLVRWNDSYKHITPIYIQILTWNIE